MSSFGPPGGGEGTRVVRDDASQWEVELQLHGKPDDVNISGMAFSYRYITVDSSRIMSIF